MGDFLKVDLGGNAVVLLPSQCPSFRVDVQKWAQPRCGEQIMPVWHGAARIPGMGCSNCRCKGGHQERVSQGLPGVRSATVSE